MTLKTDVEHSLDTFLDYFYSVSQNNAIAILEFYSHINSHIKSLT